MLRPLLTCLLLSAVASAEERKPNLLFILADDLGWADTTLYGHTSLYETPNIERLAERGMTFTQAYSSSPLCSPTRSAILTGLSPARTGLTTPNCHLPEVVLQATPGLSAPPERKAVLPKGVSRLDPEHRTLAEALKEEGYATGHFGKWHLGAEPYSPLEHGFDVDIPHHHGPGPAGSYVAPWKFKDFDHDPEVPDQHIEDRMAQEAVTWMEANRDEPFFLNYWMFSVHGPFDAKADLIEKYRSRVKPDEAQRCPTYAAMIESMDDAIGTLLDALDRLGLSDNTLIVFTSDNGGNMYNEVDNTTPTSNAPLRGGKATMFEGGIRVPGVVVWPGQVAAGSRSEVHLQSEDFFPTILEAFGIEPQPGQIFDGASVLEAWKGGNPPSRELYTYFPQTPAVPDWLPPAVSIHEGEWKLIRLFHEGDDGAHGYRLYNLKADLGETTDLSGQQPERLAAMDARIEAFLDRTGAVVPHPNPRFDPALYRPELIGVPRKKQTPGKAKAAPAGPLQGWKLREAESKPIEGGLRISSAGEGTFLGFPAGQWSGDVTATVRLRAEGAGSVHLTIFKGGELTHGEAVSWKAGDAWQNVKVTVPNEGPVGVLRVYLQPDSGHVDLDSIRMRTESGGRDWNF